MLNNNVLYCFLRLKVLTVHVRPDVNPNLKLVLLNGVLRSGIATQYGGGRDANRRYAWIGIVSFGVGCAEVRMSDPPPPLHPANVSSPALKAWWEGGGVGTHSPGGEGMGQYFGRRQTFGLASYNINPSTCYTVV
jgi:hypothetical protein